MDDNDKKHEEFKKSLIKHFENVLKLKASPCGRGYSFYISAPIIVDFEFVYSILNYYNHQDGIIWDEITSAKEGDIKLYAKKEKKILLKAHVKYGSDFIELYML